MTYAQITPANLIAETPAIGTSTVSSILPAWLGRRLAAYRARRREARFAALIMSLDAHLLGDIGVDPGVSDPQPTLLGASHARVICATALGVPVSSSVPARR